MKALAQVEAQIAPQHLDKARGCRLVEAVESLDLGNLLLVQPLTTAIAAGRRRTTTFRPLGCSLQLVHQLFHRATGHELDDDEAHQQDAQQRGHHQRQPAQHIVQHVRNLPAR